MRHLSTRKDVKNLGGVVAMVRLLIANESKRPGGLPHRRHVLTVSQEIYRAIRHAASSLDAARSPFVYFYQGRIRFYGFDLVQSPTLAGLSHVFHHID